MHIRWMMPTGDDRDFTTETISLYRINGVAGLLLIKGENILANHLPFSDMRAEKLGELVRRMMDGYTTVKRQVQKVLLNYDAGSLLVVNHGGAQIALLLTARVDLDVVTNAATMFMAEHVERLERVSSERETRSAEIRDPLAPREVVVTGSTAASNGAKLLQPAPEPEISRWPEIRKLVEAILGKAIGSAQIGNLITRVCKEAAIPDPFQLPLDAAKQLAVKILTQVPNRSKRDTLISELYSSFEEHNL